ncbi:MAG: hypothetical protein WDA27_01775 [Actinomycetota bacterium]
MADDLTPSEVEASERVEAAKGIFDSHTTMSIAMNRDGEPWVGKAFFVEDEPTAGALDICCALVLDARKLEMTRRSPRASFIVAGDVPDRWIQGAGTVRIADAEDAVEILDCLRRKTGAAGEFLERFDSTPVRIRVDRLRVTDLTATPPVTEFTFG